MKSMLSLALATFTIAAQARSPMPIRPLLQLRTDAAKTGDEILNPAPARPPFRGMTVVLKSDGTLFITSESDRKLELTVTLATETYLTLVSEAALVSDAELDENKNAVACRALPTNFRDSLSVARNVKADRTSLPGAIHPVWLQPGCYNHVLGPKGDRQYKAAEYLVNVIRILAIEAIEKNAK